MRTKQIMLSLEERNELEQFSKKGVHSVRLVNRAKIILALDSSNGEEPMKQEDIAKQIGVSRQAVHNVKKDFLSAENVVAFLQRKKRETPPVEPKVTGEIEARIIAMACGEAPEGCARWTVRLLAEKSVELQGVDSLSHMTISRLLKKHKLSLI